MGGRGWILSICMAAVGCGSPGTEAPTGRSPLSPSEGSPLPLASATPPAPLPSLEGEPTLTPAACVPWTRSAPPVQAQACEISTSHGNGERDIERYDAEGHLLERTRYLSDGSLSSRETHAWVRGHETLRRGVNGYGDWDQTDRSYDSQGRLFQEKNSASDLPANLPYRQLKTYVYADDGRLERINVQGDPRFIRTSGIIDYAYDSAGRLTSVQGRDEFQMYAYQQFTYGSNGVPRTHHESMNYDVWKTTLYDELGRRVSLEEGSGECWKKSTFSYDAAGQLNRIESQVDQHSDRRELTTYLHGQDGLLQLERFAHNTVNHDRDELFTSDRITRRITYLCGTAIVWREEWDTNDNGLVDGWAVYERDEQGRLVSQRYVGVTGQPLYKPIRIDYRYDCR